MSNLLNESNIKKRKRTNSDDNIDIEFIKIKINYLFENVDHNLLSSLQYLYSLFQEPILNIKKINTESKKRMSLLLYLLEYKKEENSKRYCQLLSTTSLNDSDYFKSMNYTDQDNIIKKIENIKQNDSKKPYIIQIFESNMPDNFKMICLNKINQMKLDSNNSQKLSHWVESFLKLPFTKSSYLPVTIDDGIDVCQLYMNKCEKILNDCVYGMHEAKGQLMQIIGKWITNPESVGSAIGLKGPMGTGKTTLVKHGVSKLLNREFAFISLGGSMDGSTLKGHSYTYEGGTYGKIADILIQCKSNNPIIFFDELDKISESEKGREIASILIHLTDTTQNNQFQDDYFSEIHLDVSKCLFIFSYNDETMINPILKDRMYTIDISGYHLNDKREISKLHLIPSIEKDLGLVSQSIWMRDNVLTFIIEKTVVEEGVRNLKRNLETIYSKLNLFRILKDTTTTIFNDLIDVSFPFEITEKIANSLMKITIEKPNYLSMYS